jgi:hypothetical protein
MTRAQVLSREQNLLGDTVRLSRATLCLALPATLLGVRGCLEGSDQEQLVRTGKLWAVCK